MAPAISLKQWPCWVIFIELQVVEFWICKGPHVVNYLPLPLTLQMDKLKSASVLTVRCKWSLALLNRTRACSVFCRVGCAPTAQAPTWHRVVPSQHRTRWPSCSSPGPFPSASFLSHPLSPPLGPRFLEHPSLSFILNFSVASLPQPGHMLFISHFKPFLPSASPPATGPPLISPPGKGVCTLSILSPLVCFDPL